MFLYIFLSISQFFSTAPIDPKQNTGTCSWHLGGHSQPSQVSRVTQEYRMNRSPREMVVINFLDQNTAIETLL